MMTVKVLASLKVASVPSTVAVMTTTIQVFFSLSGLSSPEFPSPPLPTVRSTD
ncbi:MAG: hypothetical protein BWY89_01923 [Bacteroidetes bacterium ADurb.BinA012]|nr:MAG: hypothetical protein BWY89_01923 [Bacteroidetes bacterium ADurb.BinA012]